MSDSTISKKRRWPARNVAIAASHELFSSPEEALRETIRDRLQRRIEILTQHRLGRKWCPYAIESTRLNRSIESGVDDVKFLYPVLDNIPVVVLPLLNFARAGIRICLYAPPEVCRVAEVVRDYVAQIGWIRDTCDLITVQEDKSRISFFDSFKRSTAPLIAADADDAIVWTAADLVLAYDVWPWLLERDIHDHDIVVNMIARELIFPPGTNEFLRLEYFDSLLPVGQTRSREVRQPDMLVFTQRGRDGLANLDRIRGRPEAELLGIFLKTSWRGLLSRKAGSVLRAIHYGIKRKQYSLRPGDGISQTHASAFASVFFGVDTLVKGECADPLIVKDADGFEEIFGYYRTLLQGVVEAATTKEEGYRKLEAYYPHAEHLFRLSSRLAPLWSEIPLWRRWPEFICDKTSTYNTRLKMAFKEAGVDDSTMPIPEYFTREGEFIFHPPPRHSSIPGSLAFLAEVYRPRYEQGRRQWLQAR
ncbi:hypothetical protein [Burkholderia sp. BDU5]|uniref:hypothetical protein n=1 Tax=Burkholderia sp. BDU5 TaxID=1385590 RepID=UPI000AE4A464|nr:hypothetical protein [Burkholderia sp. BDU5]